MNTKEVLKWTTLIIFGGLVETLLYHFRFENPLLRRELILEMQQGNGYFLIFAAVDFIFLVMFFIWYSLAATEKKRSKKQ